MRKYFRDYINYIAAVLAEAESGKTPKGSRTSIDEAFMTTFRRMIAQMQHERLVHLIVTVLFALLTVMSLGFLAANPSLQMSLLFMLFLILVIPYIEHYYFLENGVQKLYRYYDRIEDYIKQNAAKI
jgi:hypothetical protein